jgi:MFS transporter, DHA2 family, multidrug resistance protein
VRSRPAKWPWLITITCGLVAYVAGSSGMALSFDLVVQAVISDRWRYQWVTGPAAVIHLLFLAVMFALPNWMGLRRAFIVGAVCMSVGALGSAVATNPWQMGAAQVVLAATPMMLVPSLVTTMRVTGPRGRYFFLSVAFGAGMICEGIGGLLAFNPSWRAMFLGSALVGVWLIAYGAFALPEDAPTSPPVDRFDWAGTTLLAAIAGLVVFLCYRGQYLGWFDSLAISLAVLAVPVAIALFVWRELVASRPLLSLGLFVHAAGTLATLTSLLWNAALAALAVVVARYLTACGFQTWQAGLILIAAGLVSLAMMFGGSVFAQHAPVSYTLGVLWLSLAGMAACTFWLSFVDITAPWHRVLAGTILAGAFGGLALGPTIAFMVRDQSPAEELRVRASKFFLRFFGGSLGTLLAGVILATGINTAHESLRLGMIPGLDPTHQIRRAIENQAIARGSSVPEATTQAVALLDAWIQQNAVVMGYQTTLRWVALFSAAALAVALLIPAAQGFSRL